MNQGAVQSSPVQQMVAAAGSSGWWSIRPPSFHQRQPFLSVPPHDDLPHQPTPPTLVAAPSWNPEEPPESFSQLLLGGLVGAEDKLSLRNLENWEQFILNQASDSTCMNDLKQENLGSNHYSCSSEEVEFQAAKVSLWSHQGASASPPNSCVSTNNMIDFSPKSSDLNHPQQDPSSECNSTGSATGGAAKKARIQASSAQSTFKVRKEKLGDRITALHQLVSPFGKTDTASVLLEAIGYIGFLQSQIEALSLPYLDSKSGSLGQQFPESDENPRKDLKSRGLCLVPVSCTLHVGSDNGADYWAPAFGANFR